MTTALCLYIIKTSSCVNDDYWMPPESEELLWSIIVDDPINRVELSYDRVNSMIIRVMSKLSAALNSMQLGLKEKQPTIAVSIPEGPWLQIAVLAIHFMNVAASCKSRAPVLLPLDPDEGIERLSHMIVDAQPNIILYASEKDKEKLMNAAFASKGSSNQTSSIEIDDILFTNIRNFSNESIKMTEPIDFLFKYISPCEIENRLSHICYTSGTSGNPKGCMSSIHSLLYYIKEKNRTHLISPDSRIFLASSLPFDPCFSDIIATYYAGATLCMSSREATKDHLSSLILHLQVTHILCTPSLWNGVQSESRNYLGSLKVVALGGEPMSGRVRGWWARSRDKTGKPVGTVRLLSTYGVTEACVYQTVTEVFASDDSLKDGGNDVGLPLNGIRIKICSSENISEVPQGQKGEIFLSGNQLDLFSSYLNLPDVASKKFITIGSEIFYRTGDLGFIDENTGHLFMCGRIIGEEGLVKFNGVRLELEEIENAILDSVFMTRQEGYISIVSGCLVDVKALNDEGAKRMTAYCVLSDKCLQEMNISFRDDIKGIICSSGTPLTTLLKARCEKRVRKGCTPSNFVLIGKIPLTRTGKCDRKAIPALEECIPELSLYKEKVGVPLKLCGSIGSALHSELVSTLNIPPTQQHMITTTSSFSMLGGDSLTATRVVRSLYAIHEGVSNSRSLGGELGILPYPFDASSLIKAKTLEEYIHLIESVQFERDPNYKISSQSSFQIPCSNSYTETTEDNRMYESLMDAIRLGQTTIAVTFLMEGTNPNVEVSSVRLGKIHSRSAMKESFRTTPIHLACMKGDVSLVKALVQSGCCTKTPDASGSFPIHLACCGSGNGLSSRIDHKNQSRFEQEDNRRLECVRYLLENTNIPLTMKNKNNQTIIHCAARSGFKKLLQFLIERWISDERIQPVKAWGDSSLDWQDRWFRTPIHWGVLHLHPEVVRLLIEHGASANPRQPRMKFKIGKRTSGVLESPLEICNRYLNEMPESEDVNTILKLLKSRQKI